MTINSEEQVARRSLRIRLGLVLLILMASFGTALWWAVNVPYLALRGVPIYPNADIQLDNRYSFWTDAGPMAVIIYDTGQPWPEIVKFYRDEMAHQGWRFDQEDSMDVQGGKTNTYYHAICLVFRRAPVFVANVKISGTIEDNKVLSTTVTVDTAPNNKGFCR
jgi:hypothetical protein